MVAGDDAKAACPALSEVSAPDEFARREANEKVLAMCKTENEQALLHLKDCPSFISLLGRLDDYDFDRKAFRVVLQKGHTVLVTNAGRIWLRDENLLLTWPGSARRSAGSATASQCVGAMADAVPALAELLIEVEMPEQEARVLRNKIGAEMIKVEIALLLDGASGKDDMPCDTKTASAASGRTLAWRVVLEKNWEALTPWQSIARWNPPESCSEARSFFGLKPNAYPVGPKY
jgi:hypothetical protein